MIIRILFIFHLFLCGTLFGFNDEPACYQRIKTTFFKDDIVVQAFSLYNIPQSQWNPLAREVVRQAAYVPQIIKVRTQYLVRSPLEYPFQTKEAMELLMQVLFEVFERAMRNNYIYNKDDIQGMFNYIRSQQGQLIQDCMQFE